jgi:hypothetical protein
MGLFFLGLRLLGRVVIMSVEQLSSLILLHLSRILNNLLDNFLFAHHVLHLRLSLLIQANWIVHLVEHVLLVE